MIQQPNWLEMVLHREQDQQHSIGEVCWNTGLYLLWFLVLSTKWTRTIITNGIFSTCIGLSLPMACTAALTDDKRRPTKQKLIYGLIPKNKRIGINLKMLVIIISLSL